MNSTTLPINPEIGSTYYVPFWVLLEFLDVSPPDPFVKVEVLTTETKVAGSPKGPVEVLCCDLRCDSKKQLIAHNIPAQYLIAPENLREWANRIADWFRDFGERDEDSSPNS
jgi:hypothetical protein